MSHTIGAWDQNHKAGSELRISDPKMLYSLAKEVFKGDLRAEKIIQKHFEPQMIKPQLAQKKPQDLLFHPPF